MTNRTRYIISLLAIVATSFLLSSPMPLQATIATKQRMVYSIDGKSIGKIPKMGQYFALERLQDGRIKIRYRDNKVGYIN